MHFVHKNCSGRDGRYSHHVDTHSTSCKSSQSCSPDSVAAQVPREKPTRGDKTQFPERMRNDNLTN